MEIVYTPKALEDLKQLKKDLADQWGDAIAVNVLRGIITDINRLEEFPLLGVGLGDLINVPTKYRSIFTEKHYVFYQIESNKIQVIRVMHERQDFMRQLFPPG